MILFEDVWNIWLIITNALQSILVPVATIFLIILVKHLTKYLKARTSYIKVKLGVRK